MLSENIKNIRKQNGLTQEAFAIKLNVVRQTVSKWEKGISVPDAQTLQLISDVFEIPVQEILGEVSTPEISPNNIADQLARINEQLAIRNRRSANIWKVVCLVLLLALGFLIGKMVTTTYQEKKEAAIVMPEKIEVSGVSFSGDQNKIGVSFVPNIGSNDINYKVTFHCNELAVEDVTENAKYENGICTAEYKRDRIYGWVGYTVVLNIEYEGIIRNVVLAKDFGVHESGFTWEPLWN